jgi:hypothetical protein
MDLDFLHAHTQSCDGPDCMIVSMSVSRIAKNLDPSFVAAVAFYFGPLNTHLRIRYGFPFGHIIELCCLLCLVRLLTIL